MHWIWSGDGTPQSCTSAILEIDFAFGSKNPTDVSQLAALAVGVSSNDNNNLIITSKLRRNGKGDEGIYLHTRFFTVRLPLAETFIIKEGTNQMLEANHKMWIFGVKFLEIDYEIKKIEEK